EPPEGDETRSWMPPTDAEGRSTYFLTVNRNKRSLMLDLKDPVDLDLAQQLVSRADVLIENFRPGTMEKFGLGYESISSTNPGIIYCSITGFGRKDGASMPGYDPLVQAVSGLMSVTGPADGEASKTGSALVDVIAGLNATNGILAALRARERDRVGQRVEVNLLSTALSALANQASAYLNTGVSPARMGNVHPSIEPFGTYTAADGPLMICAGNDHQFHQLALTIGSPQLIEDPRFAGNSDRVDNRDQLRPEIESRLSLESVAHWTGSLNEAGVPAGPVNDIGGGFRLAESLGLEPTDEFDGARSPRSPLELSGAPVSTRRRPPELDEHGVELRAWLQGADGPNAVGRPVTDPPD
ncbi:MAG: CoA transferase, partial [Solirubrobacterales bacterium]